ncbi:hypothetical protein PSACC_01157 [Paramicrosporidium saccamoebae]|uniref:Trafficking protein particle complex subunit n=1 Tax=Paramicrosporidium saccamoebae TaxID=1246581 RepID=A0A2H9TMP1_9FUNG|nr:hypothetical protein PSACC_01157 [Paramicrosporidium saccamoebae]
MIYRLLIFDRQYRCRLDRHFGPRGNLPDEDSMSLLLGLCHSLRGTLRKLAPSPSSSFSYRTNRYRLHYYESPSGWRFVMLMGGPTGSCVYAGTTVTETTALKTFYAGPFVDWVVKNPMVAPLDGEMLGPGGFTAKMEEFFALPIFIS